MKKLLALLLALVMVVCCLTACGPKQNENPQNSGTPGTPGTSTPAPGAQGGETPGGTPEGPVANVVSGEVAPNLVKSDETLTVVLPEEPASLLGGTNTGTHTVMLTSLLTDMLAKYNLETGKLEPGLFTAWEWLDDAHTELKCTVREGVVATDGSILTAHDILFSFKELAPTSASFLNQIDLENTRVEGDYTLIIKVANGSSTFADNMSNRGTIFIYDESSYLASGGAENTTNPQWGTGKYKFVEWVPGQHILLERNENHWDTSNVPYYKYIKFTFVTDSATRIMAIQSGNADVAPAVTVAQALELIGNESCGVTFMSTKNVDRFYMNSSEGHPTSDIRVRQAICYALSAEMLNMVHTSGVSPIEPYFITSESRYYFDPSGGKGFEYNPEKAKQLLAEAGYANGLELTGIVQVQNEAIFTAAQAMLGEVGITLNFTTPDVPTFIEMGKAGEYDFMFTNGNSGKFFREGAVFYVVEPNYTWVGGPKISDPVLQGYVDTATDSLNEEEAVKAIQNIVQYLYDGYYTFGMGRSLNAVVHNSGLEGFYAGTGSNIDISLIRPVK